MVQEYQRKIATEEYEKYGIEMAEILPKYFEAVHDHHNSYADHKATVSKEEKDQMARRDQARKAKEEEEEVERQQRMLKARELEEVKNALTQRQDFLQKQSKVSKARSKIQVTPT